MTVSNAGKWSPWYNEIAYGADPAPYADTATYQMGADWLTGCANVEDWGCGTGWARQFFNTSQYTGVDGTASPFADHVADLTVYRSSVDGVFMRHVLEHNHQWRRVLDNAVQSFRKRMVLILFTPMVDNTIIIPPYDNDGIDVPNIAFRHEDLAERFGRASFSFTDLPSDTFYGTERIYLLEKPGA